MEWIDILTEKGSPTQTRAEKSLIHQLGFWHASAHLWITHPDGRILIQRRSPQKENDPGLWDVSVAGHILTQETPLAAAIREAQEEIGLAVLAARLTPLARFRADRLLNNGAYKDREFQYLFWTVCDWPLAAFTLQQEEVAELDWIAPTALARAAASQDPLFVPHGEQYDYILAYLHNRKTPADPH